MTSQIGPDKVQEQQVLVTWDWDVHILEFTLEGYVQMR